MNTAEDAMSSIYLEGSCSLVSQKNFSLSYSDRSWQKEMRTLRWTFYYSNPSLLLYSIGAMVQFNFFYMNILDAWFSLSKMGAPPDLVPLLIKLNIGSFFPHLLNSAEVCSVDNRGMMIL